MPPRITAAASGRIWLDACALTQARRPLRALVQNTFAMGKAAQVLAEYTDADGRTDSVSRLDAPLCLIDKPEVAAATDQGVVMARVFREGGDRGAQIWQRVGESAGTEQGETMDRVSIPAKLSIGLMRRGLPVSAIAAS